MTEQEFANLPFLITRRQFLDATGIPDRMLTQAVAAGEIRQFRLTNSGRKHRYYKNEAALLRYPSDLPQVWHRQTRWLCRHGEGNRLLEHLAGMEQCVALLKQAVEQIKQTNMKELA